MRFRIFMYRNKGGKQSGYPGSQHILSMRCMNEKGHGGYVLTFRKKRRHRPKPGDAFVSGSCLFCKHFKEFVFCQGCGAYIDFIFSVRFAGQVSIRPDQKQIGLRG